MTPISRHTILVRRARSTLQLLGSLKLAIPLLATVAIVIAAATIIEANRGREYAQWYVYHSRWFAALLGLLALNIFCAAASRWPWKRHQTGFVITHCGLLILLAGAVQTFSGGIEGQVTIAEGQTTSKMLIPQQSQVTVSWLDRPNEAPYEFVFEPGPADWRDGKALELGEVDGIRARVVRYIRHARVVETWIPDASGNSGLSVRFKVEGPQGSATPEQVLVDQEYGDETMFGPVRVQLQRAVSAAMLADFLEPPAVGIGKNPKGLLVAYHKGTVKRIAVDMDLQKRIALDENGTAVEIVNYFANAKPAAGGGFQSIGEAPANPMLELKVYLPGQQQPLRQIASAKNPLLVLDPVYGQDCPVKFRYYHAALKPATAIDLMQATDDKLYGRVCAENRVTPIGLVSPGHRIQMPGNYTFVITDHRPHVRQSISFESLKADPKQKDAAEAVEVEIAAGSVTQRVWLQRDDPSFGTQAIATRSGPLQVRFGRGEQRLGFALKLLAFRRETNPGGVGNATFASTMLLTDESRGVEQQREISMNQPLTYKRLTFYQSSFDEGGHGVRSSTFSVGYDPGRTLKYAGSLLICLGIAVMFYMRAYFFKKRPTTNLEQLQQHEEFGSHYSIDLSPVPVNDHDASAGNVMAIGSGH
jgi:hypothetical protein